MLYIETYFTYKETSRKKRMDKLHYSISMCEKDGVIILISYEEDVTTRSITTREKDGNFIMIKDQLIKGDLRILNVYTPNEKFQNA